MKIIHKKIVILLFIICASVGSFFLYRIVSESLRMKSKRETTLQTIITLWNESDYEVVITESEKYLLQYPEDSYVRILRGIALLNSAELGVNSVYKKDIERIWQTVYEIRRALVINPHVAYKHESLYVLGKAYYLLGYAQNLKAIEYLEEAVENKIASADLHEFLVAAYKNENRYDDAIALIKKMLSKFKNGIEGPSLSSLQLTLIDLLLDINKVDAATDYIQEGLANATLTLPEKTAFTIRSARVLLIQKYENKAIELLSVIIKKDPNSFEALYYMGVAYEMKGETGKARYYWRKVLSINPYWDKILEKLNITL